MCIFLMCIVFCNCRIFQPQDWCAKHYPAQISDSIVTVTNYECDWDTVMVPFKSIVFDTVGLIPNDVVFHHESKKDGLSAYIDINKGKLTFRCAEDSLEAVIEYQKKIISTTDHQVKVITMPCILEHKTKFNYFCSYWFWISFGLILIWLVLKALKMYLKG